MSVLESPGDLAPMIWLVAVVALVAAASLGLCVLGLRRAARAERRLDGLRRELAVFAEASTRVADTLEHLLKGEVEPREAPVTSRRYLLLQARRGLEAGEEVDALAARLELCDDEKRLLALVHGPGVGSRARVA
jgi:hypothetical protein